jgi:Plavaka transposase
MIERRPLLPKRKRQLPVRFRDELPQPPTPLSLLSPLARARAEVPVGHPTRSSPPRSIADSVTADSRGILTTLPNVFGLFRRYTILAMNTYDPDENLSLSDMSNIPEASPVDLEELDLYPFPNPSSFRLADWHWNGGVQKSLGSFNDLVSLITDPEFKAEDIKTANWSLIHSELGTDDDEADWLDEDAGWTHTSVTVSVPYQSRRGVPSASGSGPKNYTINNFYHRKLVSVIRERILGLSGNHQFHFSPYEMYWQRNQSEEPIRVQGELFSSPEFIEADRDIQDMPGEPGCNLPRVLVALMFWSDVTHLTSFGSAKIWPLYMYFGNDSKYLRCKPSSHLCEHIAYFQSVC